LASTTARDVLANRAGVCRDFAHLAIAFCRALNIPARFVTGYARYSDPPPDFHAVFEAYLGKRWYLFDPTELAALDEIVRIGTGRDAAEAAFATFFGSAQLRRLSPLIELAASDTPADAKSTTLVPLQKPGAGISLGA
jgi:transglutaminase-like putative cysteine protease